MPLPNADARIKIFQKLIPQKLPVLLCKEDWESIIIETEGLAGGDILNVILNASSTAIVREGPSCKIKLNDFLTAIYESKKAKQEIGL
jgi:ATP-dependent 26S proteasome regulatory subunit